MNGEDFGKCITVQRTDIFIEKTCKKCISLQRSVIFINIALRWSEIPIQQCFYKYAVPLELIQNLFSEILPVYSITTQKQRGEFYFNKIHLVS